MLSQDCNRCALANTDFSAVFPGGRRGDDNKSDSAVVEACVLAQEWHLPLANSSSGIS
jgi:hypothetical protein